MSKPATFGRATAFGAVLWLAAAPAWSQGDDESLRYWPRWRGPLATGVAPHGNPPVTWGEQENVKWKVEIPGKG
ncbi:MAG TPA: hypothetical protein VF170_03690, partial [Planctomycetaceae bacterium]